MSENRDKYPSQIPIGQDGIFNWLTLSDQQSKTHKDVWFLSIWNKKIVRNSHTWGFRNNNELLKLLLIISSQLIAVKCVTNSFEHGISKISFRRQLSRQNIFIQKQAKKNFNPIYYNSYIIIVLIVHVDIVSYISSISSVISVIWWTVSTKKTKNIIYTMKTPVRILTDVLLFWHR